MVVSQALQFIEQRMDALNDEMRRAVEALKRFKEENQLVSLSESVKLAIDQLVELDKSQQKIDTMRQQAGLLLKALQGRRSLDQKSLFALGNDLNQPLLVSLAKDLSQLEAERAALRTQYTQRHPTVMALDHKILKLKAKIRAEIKSLIASLDAQKRALSKEASAAESRLRQLPEKEQRLAELMRRAKVYEDTFSFLLQKKGELQVTRASQIGDVWLVDPPHADLRYIKPRLRMNVMLAAVVGLMLGVGLVFLLEYLDDSVKNANDVQTTVGLPILGNIGHYMSSQNGRPQRNLSRMPIILEEPKSPMAEAFRTLRSNLLFTGVDQPRRKMLLTSALPEDGKSTCSANLGVALAQMGKRVLLVDCDLRKPQLHWFFHLRRSPGLVNVLVEEEWEKALDGAIQHTQVPHLYLLTCGDVPPNPNEILGSEKMGHLIESVAERYDFILFDTPPVLTVSDAIVLAHRVDGVMLVARAGCTSRSALRNVVELLSKTRTVILGIILNDIDFKRERYYYSYYYHYYRSYGEEGSETSKKRVRI